MSNKDKETRPVEILPIRIALADGTTQTFETHAQFNRWIDEVTPLVGDRVAFGQGSWLPLKDYVASKSGIMSVELFESLSLDGSSIDALSVEPGQVEETLPRSPAFSLEGKKAPPPLPPKIPQELPKGPVRTQQYGAAQDFGLRASDEVGSAGVRDTEEHPFPDWVPDAGETIVEPAPANMAPPPPISIQRPPESDIDAHLPTQEPSDAGSPLAVTPKAVDHRPTRTMSDPQRPKYPADAPTLSFEGEERPEIIHEVNAPSGALKGFILGVATTLALIAALYLGGFVPIGTTTQPIVDTPVADSGKDTGAQSATSKATVPAKTNAAKATQQKEQPAAAEKPATKDASVVSDTAVPAHNPAPSAASSGQAKEPLPDAAVTKTDVDAVQKAPSETKAQNQPTNAVPGDSKPIAGKSTTAEAQETSASVQAKAKTKKAAVAAEDAPTPKKEPASSPVSARDFARLMKAGLEELESGRPRKAKALFEKAAKANPASPRPVSNLGWCAIELGQAKQGVRHFRRALKLDSSHRDALFGLGAAQAKAGLKSDAIATYRDFLRKYPDDQKARMVQFRLDKLGGE